MVGLDGFEPSTSRLSGGRSNQLSYRPLRHLLRMRFRLHCAAHNQDLRTTVWDTSLGLQKLNSVWRQMGRQLASSPIERVTGRTRDSN